MKNLIKSITNYEFANDEFRISLLLFLVTTILITIDNALGWVWLAAPALCSFILCAVFFIIGAMKVQNED